MASRLKCGGLYAELTSNAMCGVTCTVKSSHQTMRLRLKFLERRAGNDNGNGRRRGIWEKYGGGIRYGYMWRSARMQSATTTCCSCRLHAINIDAISIEVGQVSTGEVVYTLTSSELQSLAASNIFDAAWATIYTIKCMKYIHLNYIKVINQLFVLSVLKI